MSNEYGIAMSLGTALVLSAGLCAAGPLEVSLLRIDYEMISREAYCITDVGAPGKQGVTFACGRFVGTGVGLRQQAPLTRRLALLADAMYARGEAGGWSSRVTHAAATLGVAWDFSAHGQAGLQAGAATFVPQGTGVFSRHAHWHSAFGLYVQRTLLPPAPLGMTVRAGYFRTLLDDYYFGTTAVEALLVQAGITLGGGRAAADASFRTLPE